MSFDLSSFVLSYGYFVIAHWLVNIWNKGDNHYLKVLLEFYIAMLFGLYPLSSILQMPLSPSITIICTTADLFSVSRSCHFTFSLVLPPVPWSMIKALCSLIIQNQFLYSTALPLPLVSLNWVLSFSKNFQNHCTLCLSMSTQ